MVDGISDIPSSGMAQATREYDIIFAGGLFYPYMSIQTPQLLPIAGGTAACAVAGHITAADPLLKILILEAGPHTKYEPCCVEPSRCIQHLELRDPFTSIHVAEPSPYLNGRQRKVNSGRRQLGTCAIRPRQQGGVVDSRLNVQGLKVADLSVAPLNVASNTYSSALVIGEKASIIIAEELGIDSV
ncbi:hypothetical protein OG21DRAFT_77035 [Imleria badia]|nr:hypothetical protein OG21DRAFT_77035 [Imleria badia]